MTRQDQPLGEVLRRGDQWGLRYERILQHPPERVWKALTESNDLRHWMPCDIVGERRAGAEIELVFWPDHVERYGIEEPVTYGTILTWDPHRVFEWTWDTDLLRWELEPVEGGTRLTLTTWLGKDVDVAKDAAAGYHVCLDQLIELLDSGSTGPLVDADVERWEQEYAEAVDRAG
jgi:uncharacterized protein YndB with AHSA1/START domain